MSSATTPKRFFLRHARSGSLPTEEDPTFNQHLTDKGLAQAAEVGRGEIGAFARSIGTRIFCSTSDRAIETLLLVLDPDGGGVAIMALRAAVRGREAKKIQFSDERFLNLEVPLPQLLANVTFDQRLYQEVPQEIVGAGGNLLVVSHYDAGKAFFNGRELRNLECVPF
jgi:hypothetical protein